MDRFIAHTQERMNCWRMYLKSNMDRFIVFNFHKFRILSRDLKSNMDRFIDSSKLSYTGAKGI